MADWITEGTARRTGVRMVPVMHLLIRDSGEWSMWCSGNPGRQDSGYPEFRTCRDCRQLAQDAVHEGILSPTDPAIVNWRIAA